MRRNVRSGFTLIELLVVIAIIAVLAAILFPVFARARENARRASCQSNLKQIGLAVVQYTQDYDEKYPMHNPDDPIGYNAIVWDYATSTRLNWNDAIQPYLKNWQIYRCPSAPKNSTYPPNGNSSSSYMGNGVVFRRPGTAQIDSAVSVAVIPETSKTILVHEAANASNQSAVNPRKALNDTFFYCPLDVSHDLMHFDGGNLLFCDGHVKWSKQRSIPISGFGLNSSAIGPVACGSGTTFTPLF
jgi:prepilin-type N-terminal cleavage/methylation domain-containing protein/prepilin-type processing-associated H-X9-DG protein